MFFKGTLLILFLMFSSQQRFKQADEHFPELFLEWPYMATRDTFPVLFTNTLGFSDKTEL